MRLPRRRRRWRQGGNSTSWIGARQNNISVGDDFLEYIAECDEDMSVRWGKKWVDVPENKAASKHEGDLRAPGRTQNSPVRRPASASAKAAAELAHKMDDAVEAAMAAAELAAAGPAGNRAVSDGIEMLTSGTVTALRVGRLGKVRPRAILGLERLALSLCCTLAAQTGRLPPRGERLPALGVVGSRARQAPSRQDPAV